MKEEILDNIDNPHHLEKLYRFNKSVFKQEFNQLLPQLSNNSVAEFWNARLNFESPAVTWGSNKDLIFVIVASLFAGLLVKLPDIFQIDELFFYTRNAAFVFGPFLAAYFIRKNKIGMKKILPAIVIALASLIFINALPNNEESHTLILACIHLPLVLWALLGFAFIGANLKANNKKIDYLRYNGDLIVISTLIGIAGMILTMLSIMLFSLIGLDIGEIYANYVAIIGLAAIPIVGTYVIQTNPLLVNKVSPVIAKIFCPLVLVTLVVYIIAIIVSGKDPYNDREFLIVFNALLIGVLAIILFSVVETTRSATSKLYTVILFLLSVATIVVNIIALSAIVFRLFEWGISPNRLAVLGANILILINLLIVAIKLFRAISNNSKLDEVGTSIARFIPLYIVWAAIVTFVFPVVFNFS